MSDSEEKGCATAVGELLLSLACLAVVYAMRAYTVEGVWAALVSPVLSLPRISAVQAAGLLCAVQCFWPTPRLAVDPRPAWLVVVHNGVHCLILLGIAKVVCWLGAP